MKHGIGTLALLLGLSVTAAASAAPVVAWTGFYVGAHGGGGWLGNNQDAIVDQIQQASFAFVPSRGIVVVPGTVVSFPAGKQSGSSGFAGLQAGYAFGWDHVILGAEADIRTGSRAVNFSGTAALPPTAIQAASTATDTRSLEMDFGWSVRGRLGYAWDMFQLYATGGIAGGNFAMTARGTLADPGGLSAACLPLPACQSSNLPVTNITGASLHGGRSGWTAGGGGEVAIEDGLSLALEYRHSDYGRVNFSGATNDISVSTITIPTPAGSNTAGSLPPKVIFGASQFDLMEDAVTLRFNVHL